ncbi:two-component system response regulator [Gammaproteobacteria bacterium 54_18_T64]|mgnify:FL=1|nr:two-component system response regulator [Gammaproteobacteria bacterium 54_18_T64]
MRSSNLGLTDLKSMNILIVDDEAANVRLLETLLDVAEYKNLVSTQDPRNVLGLCRTRAIDLLLLDINMPHMNGYEVMEQLHALGEEKPVVLVLSAQTERNYRHQALDSLALDYVLKPFDTHELLSRIRNLLEVRRAQTYMRHQNQLLEQEVHKRTQELTDSRLEVVRRLGRAAEYRDNETGLHIIRMSKIAALIAGASGMSDVQCELLLNAAPMHDIGKIGIPDHILQKPGKLTADEWHIMKTHSQIGADILQGDNSVLLLTAKEICLSHHEKWDGNGYPNGLDGEAIPLMARITALADVFDALTSVRPYKKAWDVADALALIKEESGKHFDPHLVGHFMSVVPEIIDIMGAHQEPSSE